MRYFTTDRTSLKASGASFSDGRSEINDRIVYPRKYQRCCRGRRWKSARVRRYRLEAGKILRKLLHAVRVYHPSTPLPGMWKLNLSQMLTISNHWNEGGGGPRVRVVQ